MVASDHANCKLQRTNVFLIPLLVLQF